jgi:putative nucleotidyltransferase with HDIG domain
MIMGFGTAVVQCFVLANARPKWVQIAFNVANNFIAIDLCYAVQHASPLHSGLLTAMVFFAADTIPVAVVIALTENKNAWALWRDSFFWSFPNYLAGAAAVWVVGVTEQRFGWTAGLLLLPILYIVYRSHRSYIDRLQEAKSRAEQQLAHALELAALHRRTIETLALAIEAKDQTTHDHLERVETYAIEVARVLGMKGTELEALRAAALLHDIGKLAVPEYIIAKPGKLTPAEFEKMKTHTVVGAEIVERMNFPYDVAPLVRGHHERWNGTGYPDGLEGERIPVGARILAAVDYLDALTSHRQYRRAMPTAEALALLKAESGRSFDPAVVDVMIRRHSEMADLLKQQRRITRLPIGIRVERGDAPAAGFETIAPTSDLVNLQNSVSSYTPGALDLAGLIAGIARCDSQEALFAVLRTSLRGIVPYDVLVVYLRRGEFLSSGCVDGDDSGLFEQLEIPIGEGLSGWVAEHGKAIVNGNPDVEPGYLNNPRKFSTLRSALAVPLQNGCGVAGVLSLYRKERDVFTNANLAVLTALGAAVAGALEMADEPVAK